MAQMFQSIFGEKLYLGATDDSKDDLPSPESFLNKILIKVRLISYIVSINLDLMTVKS